MASVRDRIGRGPISLTVSATGAGTWRPLDGVYSVFSVQPIPSTATTAFAVELQGTLTTSSTTPTTVVDAVTALTGAIVKSTSSVPITQIRTYSTALSSGSVVVWVSALPS